MAKSVSSDDAILAGLRKAMTVMHAPLPLNGKEGIFPGGANGKKLAETAIAQGLLTSKEETIKGGKKPKKVVSGLITEKGMRRVLDAESPKAALEALLPAVQAVGKQPDPPNPQAFRAELTRATETCVNAIKEAFAKLEGEVLKVLAPSSVPSLSPGVVLAALQSALERVETPVLPAVAPTSTTPASAPTAAGATPALEEIVAFVNRWAKEKTVGCQFDVLWNHLKERHAELTPGAFQDALRKLYDAGRIRLGGWPRMLDDLPQPQLAFFVSSKVMYYAHPAHPNG